MAIEADLVGYIDTQTSLTAGTDLFEGPMPERPDICVAVTHYAGEPATEDRVFAPSLTAPQMETGRVQVASRHTAKATALATLQTIHAKMDGLADTTISGRVYFWVESVNGEPHFLKQDADGGTGIRYTYVCDYRVKKVRG